MGYRYVVVANGERHDSLNYQSWAQASGALDAFDVLDVSATLVVVGASRAVPEGVELSVQQLSKLRLATSTGGIPAEPTAETWRGVLPIDFW